MKRTVLSIVTHAILLLTITAAHASTPAHLWSERFGGTSTDIAYSVATDAAGNVYLLATFQGTVNFGGADLSSTGYDIAIAKYDAFGVHEWSERFGGTGTDYGNSIAVDPSGNLLVTGYFSGTANFGGVGLISAGGNDVYIAKYNSAGTHQWSVRFGGANDDVGYAIDTDLSGAVFVTGTFQGSVSFGGATLISAGNNDIFLAKYNAANAHQWSTRFGGGSPDYGIALAVDASGNVIATGSFAGTVNFGGAGLVSAGANDVYLIKYSGAGAHQWSERFGGASNESATAVTVDPSGNAFLGALFLGTANFGGASLVSLGGYDIALAKYNSAGVHQWSHRYGATGNDFVQAVEADGAGDVYAAGYFPGTIDFGGGTLTTAGGVDMFLAKFNTGGVHQWSRHSGGSGDESAFALAPDLTGHVIVSGSFNGTGNFGGANLTSAGSSDIFLAKYSTVSAEPVITAVQDIGNDQGGKVKVFFKRSGGDDADASNPVTHYVALRRDDPPPPASIVHAMAAPPAPSLLAGWIEVGSISAFADDSYGIVVPTVGDSTIAHGQYYSVFMIRAATGQPSVFYPSPADSGYSLDNLAPAAPQNLVIAAHQLFWSQPPVVDFDYFTVYGSDVNLFSFANVIDYSVSAAKDVSASPYNFYFVTATDFSGNESLPAMIGTVTGVGGTPQQYVLSVSNYPNPFNPRTTVRYTVPSRGHVKVTVYDAHGALVATLFDGERNTGAYSVDWDGRAAGASVAASGIYFARIEHASGTRSKKMVMLK